MDRSIGDTACRPKRLRVSGKHHFKRSHATASLPNGREERRLLSINLTIKVFRIDCAEVLKSDVAAA